MMDTAQRIAQFEAMVRPEADPNNDMAWFSLGQAYSQASRHADAARAFARCTEINPDMSKAYQLGGQALVAAGDKDAATKTLLTGYEVAARRGDRMPMKAIGDVLTTLGVALPKVAEPSGSPVAATNGVAAPGASLPPGKFVCSKTGRPGTRMARQPFRGPLGEWIAANIGTDTLGVHPLAGYINFAPRAFRCIVTNSCGSVTSDAATLTVCPADFDCDGFVTGEDFDGYVAAFELGTSAADFDGDGFVTGEDFDGYVAAFESGC